MGHLNAARDEVLKTKPYNLKSGLAKLDKIIEEKEKEIEEKKRKDNINNLIKNAKYEKLTQNEKNKARRAYMNGGSTLNDVRGALNKLGARNKNKDTINNLTKQAKYNKLTQNQKNGVIKAYMSGNYTLNMAKQVLNNLVAGNTPNAKVNTPNAKVNTSNVKGNNEPPLSLNNIFAGKVNTLPSMKPQMKNQGTQLGEKLINNKKRELQKERQRILKIGEELKNIGNNQTAEKKKFQNKKFKIERRAHVLETELKSTKGKLEKVEKELRVTTNKLDKSNEEMAGVARGLENKIEKLK